MKVRPERHKLELIVPFLAVKNDDFDSVLTLLSTFSTRLGYYGNADVGRPRERDGEMLVVPCIGSLVDSMI